MNSWESPLALSLIVAIPSLLLGYLAHRRATAVDRATERSGIASNNKEAVGQVIDGLNRLIENLQEDNKSLRQEITELRAKLVELTTRYDVLQAEMVRLREGRMGP